MSEGNVKQKQEEKKQWKKSLKTHITDIATAAAISDLGTQSVWKYYMHLVKINLINNK